MHIHELNPWRTLIAVVIFVVILLAGFVTMTKPLLTYHLDMNESIQQLSDENAYFYPWELDGFIKKEAQNVVLFDIRDNFIFGQGHIPGAENISANDLTQEDNVERLEKLNEMGVTVVLYGENQLQANGPWMLFRQVGFDNVKILAGGYQYYAENKENLLAAKDNNSFKKGIPRYDFAEKAAPKDGAAVSTTAKKPVQVQRRQKSTVAAGGC
ncbi:rhodanese-like domain-containing protein [Maribellus maritimus]|uniref:rhodanese-like domain-containing protein n=1 Tax=Maribellus maritimus TaxID=2870838 RepID=UPI001EEB72C6|nr:rhodanese-like domain-containing protein [Maribellus maritimus]MCG6186620.1 rhodanese-like domain-containing protein [Maribellus maritimus]